MDVIVDTFFKSIIEYMESLRWGYIFSLVLLTAVVKRIWPNSLKFSIWKFDFSIGTRFKVPLIGLLLALVFFFLGDTMGKEGVKLMFQSMVVAMVLHLWFFERFEKWLYSLGRNKPKKVERQ